MSKKDLIQLIRDVTGVDVIIINRRTGLLVIFPMFDGDRSASLFTGGLLVMRNVFAQYHNNVVRIPLDDVGYTFRADHKS